MKNDFTSGTHFTGIADQEDKQKQIPKDPQVDQLLQDEQVRQLLLDPDVVQLMKLLREQPDRAQWFEIFTLQSMGFLLLSNRMMRTANANMRSKIQRLVELGLLSVA